MQNVQTLKEKFQAVVGEGMAGLKLAEITTERTKRMMALAKPFENEDLIVHEVIEIATKQMSEPGRLLADAVIKDGVVYPEILDEAACEEAMADFVQHLEWLPADGRATVAAITLWVGEEMLKSA